MNKFVVKFEQVDDCKLPGFWYSNKSFVFHNLYDAVDYFQKEFTFVKSVNYTIGGCLCIITLIEHNGNVIQPTCFWAKMPNA